MNFICHNLHVIPGLAFGSAARQHCSDRIKPVQRPKLGLATIR